MHLPFRSVFLALFVVVNPTLAGKVKAEPRSSATYYGDPSRRALDGSYRRDTWNTRAGSDERYSPAPPSNALMYDGVPMLAPIWSGLYAGINGGAGWGTFDTSHPVIGNLDLSGAIIGAHLGYLMRAGSLVAGAEIDAGWSLVSDSRALAGDTTFIADNDFLASARLRLGLTFGPALLYVTGGGAWAGFSASTDGAGGHWSKSDTRPGLVAGGGVEIGLNERMALRLEALHYWFDERTYATVDGPVAVDTDVTTVRAGLTLFFN